MRSFPPVSLIGVPTDVGAGHRGARMGPEALRIAGLGEALAAPVVRLIRPRADLTLAPSGVLSRLEGCEIAPRRDRTTEARRR